MTTDNTITTLNIDGEQFNVADLSDTVQRMVDIFNNWNKQEVEASDKLMMIKAAKSDLSRQIILQVRQDNNDAASTEDSTQPTTDEVSG